MPQLKRQKIPKYANQLHKTLPVNKQNYFNTSLNDYALPEQSRAFWKVQSIKDAQSRTMANPTSDSMREDLVRTVTAEPLVKSSGDKVWNCKTFLPRRNKGHDRLMRTMRTSNGDDGIGGQTQRGTLSSTTTTTKNLSDIKHIPATFNITDTKNLHDKLKRLLGTSNPKAIRSVFSTFSEKLPDCNDRLLTPKKLQEIFENYGSRPNLKDCETLIKLASKKHCETRNLQEGEIEEEKLGKGKREEEKLGLNYSEFDFLVHQDFFVENEQSRIPIVSLIESDDHIEKISPDVLCRKMFNANQADMVLRVLGSQVDRLNRTFVTADRNRHFLVDKNKFINVLDVTTHGALSDGAMDDLWNSSIMEYGVDFSENSKVNKVIDWRDFVKSIADYTFGQSSEETPPYLKNLSRIQDELIKSDKLPHYLQNQLEDVDSLSHHKTVIVGDKCVTRGIEGPYKSDVRRVHMKTPSYVEQIKKRVRRALFAIPKVCSESEFREIILNPNSAKLLNNRDNDTRDINSNNGDEDITRDKGEEDITIDKGEVGKTRDKGEEDITRDKGEEGRTRDKGEEDITRDKGEEDITIDKGDEDITRDKGEVGKTRDKGEVGKTRDKGEVGKTRDESSLNKEQLSSTELLSNLWRGLNHIYENNQEEHIGEDNQSTRNSYSIHGKSTIPDYKVFDKLPSHLIIDKEDVSATIYATGVVNVNSKVNLNDFIRLIYDHEESCFKDVSFAFNFDNKIEENIYRKKYAPAYSEDDTTTSEYIDSPSIEDSAMLYDLLCRHKGEMGGVPNLFKLYHHLDFDGDGYLSVNDIVLENVMKNDNMSEDERKKLKELFCKVFSNYNAVSLTDFIRGFQPLSSTLKTLPKPNESYDKNLTDFSKDMMKTISTLRPNWRNSSNIRPNGRYDNTPLKNTFKHVFPKNPYEKNVAPSDLLRTMNHDFYGDRNKMGIKSLNHTLRNGSSSHKTIMQMDKERKNLVDNARIERIRNRQEEISNRKKQIDAKLENIDRQKLNVKKVKQLTYEAK